MGRGEESVDPNDLLEMPMDRFCHYIDVEMEGPYCPASSSSTLIKVPVDLPSLENMDPIPVPIPRVHGQSAVWS